MENNIKFYMINKNRKWKSFQDCYAHHLKEMFDYHNSYGKDGFLSERTDASRIPDRAKWEAEREWNSQNKLCGGVLYGVQLDPEKSEEQIKEIESMEGFVRWVEPRQIPEKGKKQLKYTREDIFKDE